MSAVTSNELRSALTAALRRLAPEGGEREIPFNVACDVLVSMIADLLVASGRTADDIDGLALLFRERLESALAQRSGVAGHA
jgi:hypothetical protein